MYFSTFPTASNLNAFMNPKFKIKLNYPNRWINTSDERCEGINGFFQISAFYSEKSLKDVCDMEAYHKLMPYGTSPRIMTTTLKNNPCCFILPDNDQLPDMKRQSALILMYKAPIKVQENEYNYLLLRADKNHIIEIADSLQFIE